MCIIYYLQGSTETIILLYVHILAKILFSGVHKTTYTLLMNANQLFKGKLQWNIYMCPSLGLQLCIFPAFMASFASPHASTSHPTWGIFIFLKNRTVVVNGNFTFQTFIFCPAKTRTTHVSFARTRHRKFCPPDCHVFFFNTLLRMLWGNTAGKIHYNNLCIRFGCEGQRLYIWIKAGLQPLFPAVPGRKNCWADPN